MDNISYPVCLENIVSLINKPTPTAIGIAESRSVVIVSANERTVKVKYNGVNPDEVKKEIAVLNFNLDPNKI